MRGSVQHESCEQSSQLGVPLAWAAHELIFSGCGPSGCSLPGAAVLRTVVNQLPGNGADRPFTTPKRRRGALLAVSVRTRLLKAPVMTVAVGEQGSTIALAGEFALAQEHAVARAGSQPSTRIALRLPRSLSARPRADCNSSGSPPAARIAARSWCSSPPAGGLTGLLLLALASIRPPAAFGALLVSLAAAFALALFMPGPSAIAGKRAGSSALPIGAAPRHVLRAAASRASAGREHPRRRPIAR